MPNDVRFLFAFKILLSEREFVKSWLRIVRIAGCG